MPLSLVLTIFTLFAPREPSAADLIRFPDLDAVAHALSSQIVAREFFERQYAVAIPESDEQKWWGSALIETERLRAAWQALYAARTYPECPYYFRDLRNELTPREWRTGLMPPAIPDWRFRP